MASLGFNRLLFGAGGFRDPTHEPRPASGRSGGPPAPPSPGRGAKPPAWPDSLIKYLSGFGYNVSAEDGVTLVCRTPSLASPTRADRRKGRPLPGEPALLRGQARLSAPDVSVSVGGPGPGGWTPDL